MRKFENCRKFISIYRGKRRKKKIISCRLPIKKTFLAKITILFFSVIYRKQNHTITQFSSSCFKVYPIIGPNSVLLRWDENWSHGCLNIKAVIIGILVIITLTIWYRTPVCVLSFYPSRKVEEHYTKNYYILKLNIKNLSIQRAKRWKNINMLKRCYLLGSHSKDIFKHCKQLDC